MKPQITARLTGSVLFEHEAENNTIRQTLETAVKAGANLDGANLTGVYLTGANLDGEILTKAPISLMNLRWPVLITAQFMRIGCKRYSHTEWKNFTNEEISAMDYRALDLWSMFKVPLIALCDLHAGETK